MSSSLVRKKKQKRNESQSQIGWRNVCNKVISMVINHFRGFPYPITEREYAKCLQQTRKHIFSFLKWFWGGDDLNDQLAARLINFKITLNIKKKKTGLVVNNCNYIQLFLSYTSASVQTKSVAFTSRYSLLHIRSNNWRNVHQPL